MRFHFSDIFRTYENRLLAILFGAFGFVFFDRLALSFLFPFMATDLHLTNAHLGMISSALALTWALSGAAASAWADAHGQRKILLIAAVAGFSLCSALSGLVTGFLGLLAFRALMGIAEGPVLPLSQSLMIESSTPCRRGLNMGLLQGSSAGLLGAVLGPPVMIYIATNYGWREAFYASCIPGFVIAWMIWKWVHDISPVGKRTKVTAPINYRQLLKHRNILLCMLISGFFLTWFVIIISFAPTYLIGTRNFSAAQMSVVMSCLGAAWVLWGFIVPAISDRIGRRPTMSLFAFIAACCPVALIFIESPSLLGSVVLLTYTGLGCFTLFMATIPAETVPPDTVASALGLIMGVGEVIGGFLAPIVAGFAADRYGLSIAMWISAGGAAMAGLLSLFLTETAPAIVGLPARGFKENAAPSEHTI